MSACISAVEHVRKLRGGSQSQLLRASDGAHYVCKLTNNPQHVRVLANEMLATRLGHLLGLSMPRVEVIDVPGQLIEQSADLRIELGGSRIAFRPGRHFASLYVQDPTAGPVLDYLPDELLDRVTNIEEFARVLVLDKWACNVDGRQAVFSRRANQNQRYTATFIDQGYCFNAGEWSFPDSPLRGVYCKNCVYKTVSGWEAFEPGLSRAESMDANDIWQIAADIPEEWYEWDKDGLNRLVETLCLRRSIIHKLIAEFRRSTRNPFPNWRTQDSVSAGVLTS